MQRRESVTRAHDHTCSAARPPKYIDKATLLAFKVAIPGSQKARIVEVRETEQKTIRGWLKTGKWTFEI